MVCFGNCGFPPLAVVKRGCAGNFGIKDWDLGILRVSLSEIVAFRDKGGNLWGALWDKVFTVAGRDGMFGGRKDSFAEKGFTGFTG